MARRLADGLLVVGERIELAGAAARARLTDRTAPCSLLEIDALHRLENRRAAHRGHVRERRWKARRGWLVNATREGAVVAAGDEMRHTQSHGAVSVFRLCVARPEGGLGFACPEALRDDRAEMVVDHL